MTTFIGADLGWYGKPGGLDLRLGSIDRLERLNEILDWIQSQAGRNVIAFSRALEQLGFIHGTAMRPGRKAIFRLNCTHTRQFRRLRRLPSSDRMPTPILANCRAARPA